MIQAVANLLHRPIEIRRFDLDGVENHNKVLIQSDEPEHSKLRIGNIANLHFVASNNTMNAEVRYDENIIAEIDNSSGQVELAGATSHSCTD
jgi:hypothetical protein